jgi:hypothetical protein
MRNPRKWHCKDTAWAAATKEIEQEQTEKTEAEKTLCDLAALRLCVNIRLSSVSA